MLYILPPPTAPPPPSPWDLIINFHRKGYHKDVNTNILSIPKKVIKDSLNYDRRDHKNYLQSRKLTSKTQANVRQIIYV